MTRDQLTQWAEEKALHITDRGTAPESAICQRAVTALVEAYEAGMEAEREKCFKDVCPGCWQAAGEGVYAMHDGSAVWKQVLPAYRNKLGQWGHATIHMNDVPGWSSCDAHPIRERWCAIRAAMEEGKNG